MVKSSPLQMKQLDSESKVYEQATMVVNGRDIRRRVCNTKFNIVAVLVLNLQPSTGYFAHCQRALYFSVIGGRRLFESENRPCFK